MAGNNKFIRYEETTQLETYRPFEKCTGYLQDIRQEFKQEEYNFSGFMTVKEYSKYLKK